MFKTISNECLLVYLMVCSFVPPSLLPPSKYVFPNAPHRSIKVRTALECLKHALLVSRHIAKRITSKSWSERKLWFFFIFDLSSFPPPVRVSPRFHTFMYEDFLGVRSFNQLYDVSFERTYVGIWQGADDCLRIVNWVAMVWIQPSKYVTHTQGWKYAKLHISRTQMLSSR